MAQEIKKPMFKLEHKKEAIPPLSSFIARLMRFALFSFALILFSLGIGVVGYHVIAGLSWLDSLYMSSMILTGMGPVASMDTNAAKLFSSIYALYSGIAFLSITAVFFAPIFHRLLHLLNVEPDDEKN